MKPKMILRLCVVALGLSMLAGCGTASQSHAIYMEVGQRFSPTDLVIAPGDTVVWRNRSPDRHQVGIMRVTEGQVPVRDEAMAWQSPNLFHNEEWRHTFDQPGIFFFICPIHGEEDMIGVLRVEER
jgi:plastocyanin